VAVRVSFAPDLDRGIAFELIGDSIEGLLRAGLQRALAAIEEDAARKRDHEAARFLFRRGDARQLLLHPQLPRLGVAAGELFARLLQLRLRGLRRLAGLLRVSGVLLRLLLQLLLRLLPLLFCLLPLLL